MSERIDLFLFLMAGAGLFGSIGAVFGGVAGRWFRRDGKAAGAIVGPRFVQLIEHIRRDDLTPVGRAIVGGAAEGFAFLGLIGGLVGSWAHLTGRGWAWLLAMGAAVGSIAAGAILFGLLAYVLVWLGVRADGDEE